MRSCSDLWRKALLGNPGIVIFSSEIAMPLDSNASVDGRAVTVECAEPRRGLKTVSKLLRPP